MLCCWHCGGCKMRVNMSSLGMNTGLVRHTEIVEIDSRFWGVLRCKLVSLVSIVRDSPSISHIKLISTANIVLFWPYWYSEMSVDHGMCALINISIVNNFTTVSIILKFMASPVNQPIRWLLVSWFPLDVGVATAVLEITKWADRLISIHSGGSINARWPLLEETTGHKWPGRGWTVPTTPLDWMRAGQCPFTWFLTTGSCTNWSFKWPWTVLTGF